MILLIKDEQKDKKAKTPTEFKLFLLGGLGFSIAIHPLFVAYFGIIDLNVFPILMVYGLGVIAGAASMLLGIGAFLITTSEYAM